METKTVFAPMTMKGDATGELSAVFSTFSRNGAPVVDRDNDITLPTAFKNGQAVPMVWSHDWSKPIGKGVIRVEPDRAVFDGRLFMSTAAGKEAHAVLREMGDLAEYSWGFRILKHDWQTINGKRIRRILEAEVMEVSPVLKGAAGTGNSYTLALKAEQSANAATVERLLANNLLLQARIMGIEPWPTPGVDLDELAKQARAMGVAV